MKKVTAIVMIIAMIFCMAACGGSSTAGTGSSGAAASSSGSSSESSSQSSSSSAPAAPADTFKIGGEGPLTGGYANYGTSVYNGAQIAVDEINAAGGINGMQVELQFEDTQGDPESAVNAYGKLMDWGMDASMAGTFSGETASIVAAAEEDDIMLITPSGSADAAIDGNDKAFRVCFYDSYQGAAAADYVKDNNMATEVGVFYESDYDYSVGLYKAFEAEAAKVGISIVETQTFTTGTNTDFSAQINALAASGAKVIFIPIYAEEASTFLTQAKGKFADDVYFFGADGLDGILGKVAQDPSIANNVLMLTPFAAESSDPAVQAFVKAYQDKFGATPDQFAADGYDAVYVIKAAAEACGSSSGSEMAKAMTSLTVEGITGTMTWTADGNTNKPASAILYFDGEGSVFGE